MKLNDVLGVVLPNEKLDIEDRNGHTLFYGTYNYLNLDKNYDVILITCYDNSDDYDLQDLVLLIRLDL